jgi:hypothetical protein
MLATTGSKKCVCGKTISANALYCRECAGKIPAQPSGGMLEILNVQGGDVKITFEKGNVSEVIRAKRIITDMLRRGYAIVVEVERNGERAYERIQAFDEARGEYIIADFDAMAAHEADLEETAARLRKLREPESALPDAPEPKFDAPEPKRRGRPPSKRVPMEGAKATGIGRSAGG